jgi:hypothetical protein
MRALARDSGFSEVDETVSMLPRRALLATVPLLLLPARLELVLVEFAGGVHLRRGVRCRAWCGASRARSLVYALIVLVLAVGIASLKNVLAGH